MPFTPEKLATTLLSMGKPTTIWVGFSGGLDSTVLLHALAQLSEPLGFRLLVLHVHHGLSPHADRWGKHCEEVCRGLSVPLQLERVDASIKRGEGQEAAAREARYRVIRERLGKGEWFATAHHQEDQAETLLLQLLRGSGVKGLAAMAPQMPFARGQLVRPLLAVSRQQLERYARQHQLKWVEDESNLDITYNRNYLRHQLMPIIKQRWPSFGATLSRSARHAAEAAQLLQQLAEQDLAGCAGEEGDTLQLSGVLALSPERQRNLLRHWIGRQDFSLPDTAQLEQIQTTLLTAAEDATPRVCWPGTELRRYRDRLYLMLPLTEHDPAQIIPWQDTRLPLTIDSLSLTLEQQSLRVELAQTRGTVTVRFRQGGERIQPWGRAGHHTLKHLFQEAGVPPWQRSRIPLIFVDERLVEVVGFWAMDTVASRLQSH